MGSLYNLLLYLLVSKVEEIEKTFFYFSISIPRVVYENFQNYYKVKNIPFKILRWCYFSFIRFFRYFFWPFLLNVRYFGVDHIYITYAILGSHKMVVVEDGVATYCDEDSKVRRKNILKSIFLGPLSCKNHFGHHDQADSIILTGILPYRLTNGVKCISVDIRELWTNSSSEKQNLILNYFNISQEDIQFLKSRSKILFTQPLSEDGIITEREKIQLYKKLLGNIDYEDLVIRLHPRDKTDYHKYFCGSVIYDKQLPFELISFLDISFKVAFTIFSTAVYSLPSETLVIFGGTEMHPNLVRKFGVVHYEK